MTRYADIKRKLKSWYNKTANRYDTWGQSVGEFSTETGDKEFRSFVNLVKIRPKERVLDIGTGTGRYLLYASKQGAICYGIDISENMLKTLRLKAKALGLNFPNTKVGSAERLPYPDSFFDWVFCIGVFDYYPISFVRSVLKEINRVLKKGGKAIIDFPNKKSKGTYLFSKAEKSIGNKVYLYDDTVLVDTIRRENFRINKKKRAGIELQFLIEK